MFKYNYKKAHIIHVSQVCYAQNYAWTLKLYSGIMQNLIGVNQVHLRYYPYI